MPKPVFFKDSPSSPPDPKGFTLTELAIVMGVIGSILAAIWSASAVVHTHMQVTTATQQVLVIAQNIRSFYAGRSQIAPALQGTELTTLLENANVFPATMPLQSTTDPNWGTAMRPIHPWGSYTSVYGAVLLSPDGTTRLTSTFRISYYNLTSQQCTDFVYATVIASPASGGPIAVASYYTAPPGSSNAGHSYAANKTVNLQTMPSFGLIDAENLCGADTGSDLSAEFDFSL